MHDTRYGRVRRLLRDVYFVPPDGSERRLLQRLGLPERSIDSERNFTTAFRWSLIAAAALIVLLNIGSVKREYLERFNVDGIVAVGRSIDTSLLWERLLPREQAE